MTDDLRTVVEAGDASLYRLALLTTGAARPAQALLVRVVRQLARAAPPTDAALALHRALWHAARRRRAGRFRSALPGASTPAERLLLGLWLLERLDGTRLAAITGQSPATLVADLAGVLTRGQPEDDPRADEGHPDLRTWLAARLGWQSWPAEHGPGCRVCQTRRRAWEQLVARRQAALQAAVGQARPPHTLRARLLALLDQPSPGGARRLPLLLVGVVLLALAAVVAPRAPQRPAAVAIAPDRLVATTLARWEERPAQGVLYRQVWARSPWDAGEVLADLWISAAADGQHRVEVRQGQRLVEWQIAAGDHLWYAAEPAYATCRWNTGWQGNWRLFERGARRFAVAPGEARAVLGAWLQQGAYGQGYAALIAAQRADDLRSLGTRRAGAQSLMVLTYTDRQAQPPAQIMLWIDPARAQLHRVQQVISAGEQRVVRDLWRLVRLREYRTGVPLMLPRWKRVAGTAPLLDPACPALRLERVVSLRTLLATPWRWYVPRRLPAGLTQAVLTAPVLPDAPADRAIAADSRILLTGPGGASLSISAVAWRSAATTAPLRRGMWRIDLPPAASGRARRVTLRDARFPLSARAPTIDLWARGLSDADVLAVVDALAPLTPATWAAARHIFLEPRPLAPEAAMVIDHALAALQPDEQTVYIRARTEARSAAGSGRVLREQWLRAPPREPPAVRDQQRLPDGTLLQVVVHRGARFAWYFAASERLWTGQAEQLTPRWQPQPLDLELLMPLLTDPGAIRVEARGELLLLEQEALMPPERLRDARWIARQPDLAGLPAGGLVHRLWLDRARLQPLRLDTLHRDAYGNETPLLSTVIEERVRLATTAEALFALPGEAGAGGMGVPPAAVTERSAADR